MRSRTMAEALQPRLAVLEAGLLLLLLLVDASIGTSSSSTRDAETSSRSIADKQPPTKLGSTYARGRDFRSIATAGSEGRVSFLAPAADSMREKERKKRKKALGTEKRRGRMKRDSEGSRRKGERPWVVGDYDGSDDFLKMHAFIVRDEVVPQCFDKADKYSKTRYFMCSGIILSKNRVLTSASCINRAEISEFHLKGTELAVLIGALETNSYVIKIENYKIHPRYKPDPASIDHATNNVAVLMLSCSIPRKSLFAPVLPTDLYNDIGHACCANRCKLLTVVENLVKNELTVQSMDIKNLPEPVHDKSIDGGKDPFSKYSKKKILNKTKTRDKRFATFDSSRKNFMPLKRSLTDLTTDATSKLDETESSTLEYPTTEIEVTTNVIDFTKLQDTSTEQVDAQNFTEVTVDSQDSTVSEKNQEEDITKTAVDPHDSKTSTKNYQDITEKTVKSQDRKIKVGNSQKSTTIAADYQDSTTKTEVSQNTTIKLDNAKDSKTTLDFSLDPDWASADEELTSLNDDDDNDDAQSGQIEPPSPHLPSSSNEPIDWDEISRDLKYENVTKKNRQKLKSLMKQSMSDLMARISDAMTQQVSDVEHTFQKMQNAFKKNASWNDPTEIISSYLANEVLKNSLNELNIMICDTKVDTTPTPTDEILKKNLNCPPLGSPIVANKTLVGLVAYTCDEFQSWIKWQYVDISRNTDFILAAMEID